MQTSTVIRYDKADEVSLSEIPVIDLTPFRTGGADERRAVAAQIDAACRDIGFFYVVGHGVPESLRQNVLDEARAYFARPMDEKMQNAPLLDGQWCGYMPPRGVQEGTKPGDSLTEAFVATKVSGGTLQQFNMMRVLDADDPNYGSPDPIYQKNRWPAGAPDFVETMIVNQRAVRILAEHLMEAFALALGQPEDFFKRLHRAPLSTFGLNFYPAPPAWELEGNIGVGAHCDASSFTVLLQDDVGGLEVMHASGRWISAPYVPGAYIINIGDTMMGWTNGAFVSTEHRVVSRKAVDRFSATMFMNPDIDAVIEPLAPFVSDDNPPRFKPFPNEDYMRRFFVRFYDQMFKA